MEYIADHYGLDVYQCLLEWDQLKQLSKETPANTITSPKDLLKLIYSIKGSVGDCYTQFRNMCAAADVQVSTAAVDRIFSGVRRTVTDLRNNLKVETTYKLLHIHHKDTSLILNMLSKDGTNKNSDFSD